MPVASWATTGLASIAASPRKKTASAFASAAMSAIAPIRPRRAPLPRALGLVFAQVYRRSPSRQSHHAALSSGLQDAARWLASGAAAVTQPAQQFDRGMAILGHAQ